MVRALFLAVALVAVAITPCLAQDDVAIPLTGSPSILGPTGALITPTTQLNVENYSLGFHWLADTIDAAIKLNLSPIEKLELGVTYIDPDGPASDETVFNVKYLIADEDTDSPAVAVGVWDLADEIDQTWYAILSKTIEGEVPVTINLGGATGDILDGVFGSVIAGIHEDVDLIGEYDSEEINFGVRVRPYEGINIDLYSVDNGVDREFGAGAAYTAVW